MGIPDHLACLLGNLFAGQEELELDMEQQIGSKLGKEHVKPIYCHPAYLTSNFCLLLDLEVYIVISLSLNTFFHSPV